MNFRIVTLVAHALLIAGLAWSVGLSIGLLLVLPLLAPLRGLWLGSRYTYAWMSMLITFYCAGLLSEAYMRPSDATSLRALAIVAAIEFVSLILFVRQSAAAARAAAAARQSPGQTEA